MILEVVRQRASDPRVADQLTELLHLLWGNLGSDALSAIQRAAQRQLEKALRLLIARELEKAKGMLPNLGDNLTSLTITQGLQWIHKAAGAVNSKRPATWAETADAQEKYGTLTGANPMTWDIAVDYAQWIGPQMGRLVGAFSGIHSGKARLVARITELRDVE